MTALYRKPNSPYWYFDLADPTAPGGRRRRSTKRTNRTEALAVAKAATKSVLDRDQLGALEEVSLSVALSRYLTSVQRKADYPNILGRVNKTLGLLSTQPGRFHLNGTMPFHALTARDLRRLREAREDEGNATQTINHELKALAAAYNLMKREGVRVAPSLSFPQPKVPGKLRWLTAEEERRLLYELRQARFSGLSGKAQRQRQDNYDLTVFLLDTGCRYSEVGAIPWSAVDTVEWRWIDIYRSKTGNSSLLTMTARLRVTLRRRYATRSNSAYVFPGYAADGEDRPRGVATKAIRKAIQRAGLNAPELVARSGRCTTHTLRDTFASRLVQAGVSLFKVQQLLGHADPRMTMKYAKLEPRGVADEAAAVLDQLTAP